MSNFIEIVVSVFNFLLPGSMVVCPIVGYIPQYLMIKKTQSVGSFSPLVCYILIGAMAIRILYWYWEHYELPLLFQAMLMLVTQSLILYVIIQITGEQNNEVNMAVIERGNTVLVVVMFFALFLFFLNFLVDSAFIVKILGTMALFIEACLPVPQCYANYCKQSTKGLSLVMVYSWMAGDAFKTFYYYYRDTPIYFFVCGCLQLSIDLLILYQCTWAYNGYTKLPVHEDDEICSDDMGKGRVDEGHVSLVEAYDPPKHTYRIP